MDIFGSVEIEKATYSNHCGVGQTAINDGIGVLLLCAGYSSECQQDDK